MGCYVSVPNASDRSAFPYGQLDGSGEDSSKDVAASSRASGRKESNSPPKKAIQQLLRPLHSQLPHRHLGHSPDRSAGFTEEEDRELVEARLRAKEQARLAEALRAEEEERRRIEEEHARRPKLRKASKVKIGLAGKLLGTFKEFHVCDSICGGAGLTPDHSLLLAAVETLLRRFFGNRTVQKLQGRWVFDDMPEQKVAVISGRQINWECGAQTALELHDGSNFSTVYRGETLHGKLDWLENVRWDFGGIWCKASDGLDCLPGPARMRSTSSITQRSVSSMSLLNSSGDPLDPYQSMEGLMPMLESGDVVLVKSSYFLELFKSNGILPRRQQLPPHAICDVADLRRKAQENELQIVAVSYCWLTPDHPDPEGEQLQTLGPVIEHFPLKEHLVFFIDWCSLYQEPKTAEQHRSSQRALRKIHYWYVHHQVATWMLTDVPAWAARNDAYECRGWTSFEFRVSMMLKRQGALLNLGVLEDDMFDADFFHPQKGIMGLCAAHRCPPISPAHFNEEIATKRFHRESDAQLVMARYAEAFFDVVASIEVLNYAGWGLNAEDLKVLSEDFLPLCHRLRVLNLKGNPIGDRGVKSLAEVLPLCHTLRQLVLGGTEITDEGIVSLANVLDKCNTLQAVEIRNTSASHDAIKQLSYVWTACGKQPGSLDIW